MTDTCIWAPLTPADLPAAFAMSERIHPAFPEDFAVMAEKVRLFPAGCFFCTVDGRPAGYAVSHPWGEVPPPLNRLLGRLPEPSLYYLHDIAILAEARRSGAGAAVVTRLKAVAAGLGLARLALVAVNGSVPFWRKQGFAVHPLAGDKLASYGPDARYMVCAI